jgi:hypothetical protein
VGAVEDALKFAGIDRWIDVHRRGNPAAPGSIPIYSLRSRCLLSMHDRFRWDTLRQNAPSGYHTQ